MFYRNSTDWKTTTPISVTLWVTLCIYRKLTPWKSKYLQLPTQQEEYVYGLMIVGYVLFSVWCIYFRVYIYTWAECLLITGTGCRVQVFSLVLDSSVILSAGIQSAGDLVSETLGSKFESCIQQRKTTCLLSIRKSLACARAAKLTTTNMYYVLFSCVWFCSPNDTERPKNLHSVALCCVVFCFVFNRFSLSAMKQPRERG